MSDQAPASSRYRWATTVAAGGLGIVLSVLWMGIGLFMALLGAILADVFEEEPLTGLFGLTLPGVTEILIAFGAAVFVAGLWGLLVSIFVLLRKAWARWAGMVSFGGFGLYALVDEVRDGLEGFEFAIIALHVLVAVLLALPVTARYFADARRARAPHGNYTPVR